MTPVFGWIFRAVKAAQSIPVLLYFPTHFSYLKDMTKTLVNNEVWAEAINKIMWLNIAFFSWFSQSLCPVKS